MTPRQTFRLARADSFLPAEPAQQRLRITNDTDPRQTDLRGIAAVELVFPKFTDGRAFSQAFLLRRRLGFAGEIRATGDVLVDQLLQMWRSGFSQAVLREDQDIALGQRLLATFDGFYQGDAIHPAPRFLAVAIGT